MKIRFTLSLVFMFLLAGSAFAQVSEGERAVPNVAEPQVGNPAAPIVSNPAAAPVVPLGPPEDHCACPVTHCANGDVPSCEVHCSGDEAPVCSCDGLCDNGNPKAMNRCSCQ